MQLVRYWRTRTIAVLSVTYTRRALKDLKAVPNSDRQRLIGGLQDYVTGTGRDVTPIKGAPGCFRLRRGDWRALFEIKADVITVYRVGHRREVYR